MGLEWFSHVKTLPFPGIIGDIVQGERGSWAVASASDVETERLTAEEIKNRESVKFINLNQDRKVWGPKSH